MTNNSFNSYYVEDDDISLVGIGKSTELPKGYFPRRYLLVILGFFSIVVAYILRVVISVTVIPMQTEYNWSNSYKGMLLSGFFMGYLITQIPSHFLCERYGGKRVLLVGLTISTICSILIPLGSPSKVGIMMLRIVTGISQGVTFPTLNWMIKRYYKVSERSTCASIIWSGVYIGTIIIDTSAPQIMNSIGWQNNFYIFGGVGLLWSILWAIFIKDDPKDLMGVHPNEIYLILNDNDDKKPLLKDGAGSQIQNESNSEDLTYLQVMKLLFTNRGIYALCIFNFFTAFGFYFLLMWMPTWMKEQLGGNTGSKFAFLIVFPYVLSFIISNLSGYISDSLLNRGVKKVYIRKFFGASSAIIPGIGLFLISYVNLSSNIKIVLMIMSVSSSGFSAAGPNIVTIDLAPSYAGAVMGVANFVSTVVGIIGNLIGGILIQRFGSWTPIFTMSGTFYLFAFVIWVLFCKTDSVLKK